MTSVLIGVTLLVALLMTLLLLSRLRKERRIEVLWNSLATAGPQEWFNPRTVEQLPEAARLYLLHAIVLGTPLATSVQLKMTGSIRLSRDRPPAPMESTEVLAPPRGYVAAGGEDVATTLDLHPDGGLRGVHICRWNNDPKNGPVGYLEFVVDGFTDEARFDGYTIPTRFQAGWRSGEGGKEPFYRATIKKAEYR